MLRTFRFATFNTALSRDEAGGLIAALSTPADLQARTIAEIIQRVKPHVLLLHEFDYDAEGRALQLFRKHYLEVGQNGQRPLVYPHSFVVPSNTGVLSGADLNGDGQISLPQDAFGFGHFPGQFAFVILSKFPLYTKQIRTFQTFLWQDMPGAKLPVDPDTGEYFYSKEALAVFRLSSKNHVDVPVQLPGGVVHVLAAHPAPPIFEGPERRNSWRNFDEIRLLADYLSPGAADYLVDDHGMAGGLADGEHFVVMGDLNADPDDGNGIKQAIQQLLVHPRVNPRAATGSLVPASEGGAEFVTGDRDSHRTGNPAHVTADFQSGLRVDYVLPCSRLEVVGSGVFWPPVASELFRLVADRETGSDHRLVRVDVRLP